MASPANTLAQQALDALAAGNSAEAARLFRSVLAVDPSHVEAHHGLIRALTDLGETENAIAVALALTAITPHDPLAHTSLSVALMRGGNIPQAESAAARARVLEWKQQLAHPAESLNLD